MKALALVLLASAAVVAWVRRPRPAPEVDPMAQAFLDSRNSATYYVNLATGVTVSAN